MNIYIYVGVIVCAHVRLYEVRECKCEDVNVCKNIYVSVECIRICRCVYRRAQGETETVRTKTSSRPLQPCNPELEFGECEAEEGSEFRGHSQAAVRSPPQDLSHLWGEQAHPQRPLLLPESVTTGLAGPSGLLSGYFVPSLGGRLSSTGEVRHEGRRDSHLKII